MADTKTKSTNTFRYKSFADRVNEIDIRRLALYHIGHVNEELPEENETYFYQTLKKWIVLNLSEEYSQFSRRCMRIVTLPQLIHRKDFVIDLLLERLATATNLSLQPLLELLYVMARDLREEFYPYFQRVLDRLICLLHTQDAEQLEWTLVCLAYLFKILKPFLKKNIGVVFHAILPLLDEQRNKEHLTNFAVECFSFIARDVRDYRKFLDFVLETVSREQVDSVQGCGRLLFEIMRGVQGLFHSNAAEFLQFIFEAVLDENRKSAEKSQLLQDIVRQAVQQLLQFIHPSNMQLFWTQLCAVARTTSPTTTRICNLLELYVQAAEYRDGRYLAELDVVVPTILKLLDDAMKAQNTAALRLLIVLVSRVLLGSSTRVTQLDTSRLLKNVLAIKERDIYEEFILLMVTHAQFELLILPAVVAYFEQHFDAKAFELMAAVVVRKQPYAANATALTSWRPYPVQVKNANTLQKIAHKLEKLNFTARDESQQQQEEQLLLLILVPHLMAFNKETLLRSLQAETLKLLDHLQADGGARALNVFALLLETQIHLNGKFTQDFLGKSINALLPLAQTNAKALGALDQLLAQNPKIAQKLNIASSLSSLLSSPDRRMRLTAAHCLCTLHQHVQQQSPYKVFYETECIEPNVHTYREQLLLLQKLETGGEFFRVCDSADAHAKQDTLRFLLGMLYHNFKFVWEPVQALIEEYAKVLNPQDFWGIYMEKLQQAADGISAHGKATTAATVAAADAHSVDTWRSQALQEILGDVETPQLSLQEQMNYRNLLWMRLSKFGKVIEMKNGDLVRLFMQFVDEEYRAHFEKQEYTWDLSKATTGQEIDADDDDNDDDDVNAEAGNEERHDDVDMDDEGKVKRPTKRSKVKQQPMVKYVLQTLQSKLSIFAAYPNPRALNREKELYAFYMDLLAGSNPLLQKIALDCVCTYKMKALTPYKEHLYAIIDERRFKDELVNFKLDTIDAEHRATVMPLLLRLLYGKMMTKGSQRNVSTQVRKSIVLRFLGQCTTAEILWFLKMACGRYEKYAIAADATAAADSSDHQQQSQEDVAELVKADFRLEAVWSPRKLQSIVNLLELIRKEFGGLMERDFQVYMLRLLTFVGSVCNEVLAQQPTAMHPKMPTVFRHVRSAALQSLVNFFAHMEAYPWQPSEIASITRVFVWPTIQRLPQECIHTPTPLLKLLLQWGERPQLFAYLNQECEAGATEHGHVLFHYIVELLLSERAKIAVRKPIMAMIEKLLLASNDADALGDGLAVIRPFIADILKRLKMNFSARSTKQAIDKRDLNILSLLTRQVSEPATCDSLLQLLLPILIAKTQSSAGEEVVCQVITTLTNLIRRLPEPEVYLRRIAPLFAYVQEVQARKMLCELVADIARLRHQQASGADEQLVARLKVTARLVLLLNAWDKRWVEQPDYEKRLAALHEITQLLATDSVDMDLGVLIIYTCFYFLKYDKDIGLRDNASEHLRVLLPKLTQRYADDKPQLTYLLDEVFIDLIRRVIRDTNENVRQEGIRLLGVMARECSTAHAVLSDLAPLGDSRDVEVDFFENIVHLQSHRQGRALLKFCAHAETLQQPPTPRTLTQFVLPLATRYLLQERHAGKHTLVDAAIETVGVVCQLLPWQQYHSMLRYYLMKMRTTQEYQKQCVRIVVRILDAFHFDLSHAHADEEALQQLKRQLSETMGGTPAGKSKNAKAQPKKEQKPQQTADEAANDGGEANEDEHSAEADLETSLDSAAEKDSDNDEADAAAAIRDAPILRRLLVLTPNASRRVMQTITTILIPTLNRSITEKSSYDTKHKVNRKRFSTEREEEEILRVPIALALVKLMQKLPKELLDTSVPGVFMKVCHFLRSPLKSVRMLTRDILKKIMLTLGASYLAVLMDHLQTLLTHGFQVHVLSVTVHGVLDALRDRLQPGDIESCLGNLLDVALNDIFGEITAEKDVEKITAHTPEAKPSAKSYLVLHIAARNIQERCLLDLLMPFKEHLARSQSRRLTLKIQDCFAKIVGGLVENPHISRESLLIFIYGTMSESITDLLPGTPKRLLSEHEKEKMRRARPDCYLIQPAPRHRSSALHRNVKSNAQANAHILIEFGLEMLHIVLKRKKLADVDYPPFLNPILPLLKDALKSTHIRVTTFALKCFASIWNEEYALPELDQYLPEAVQRMFEILKNFSSFGATKQEDNWQLVKALFKAIVAMLRKCSTVELTDEQIDQLVLHIEQDLFEGDSQAMSFSLLKALIVRKVETTAIHNIMRRMSELCITSPAEFVRDEARAIITIYVTEYPLKKRIDQIVKFFTVHLCYSLATGRRSAIQLLVMLIKKFPLNMLTKRAEFLYLSLGTRLVNDDDSECRKAVADCIELLISRLAKETRQRLFDMTLLFFDAGEKSSVREMAAALCSRFLNVERQAFAVRLKLVLPLVVARLTLNNPSAPGRFVRAPNVAAVAVDDADDSTQTKSKKARRPSKKVNHSYIAKVADVVEEGVAADSEEAIARKQRDLDHEIIQMQYCLLKMLEYCGSEMLSGAGCGDAELLGVVDELAYESQRLLGHEHAWVRCNAAKMIAQIIAGFDFQLIGRKLSKAGAEHGQRCSPATVQLDYIYLNPEQDIKSLVLDLCAQLTPGDTPQPMIDEIAKVFLYVANMLRDVPFSLKKETVDERNDADADDVESETTLTKINLNWLMRNIRFLANKEIAKAPHCTSMRTALFTLIEALITLLSVESLEKLAPAVLLCLVREMSDEDQHIDAELRQLALHVGSRLRKRIGSQVYDKMRAGAQLKLMMRRAERKKVIAQEKIHDPVRAAKRKVGMQERKKAAKKRKVQVIRGKAADVKQKLKKRKRKADDDIF